MWIVGLIGRLVARIKRLLGIKGPDLTKDLPPGTDMLDFPP